MAGPWTPARAFAFGSLLAIAALWCDPAAAQWVWRDSRKQMHSSDMPPPKEIPDRDILSRPGPRPDSAPAAVPAPAASAPVAAAPSKLEAEVSARRQRAAEEEKAKREAEDKATAEARAENCKNARRELAGLESGVRIAVTNDKGEREFLDDKARADATQRTRAIATRDCAPGQ